MTVGSILGAIIIGAIIGALGRLVLPGKQKIGILWTIAVGIVAALVGTAIVNSFDDNPRDWIELAVQVALAALGVMALVAIKSGGRTRSRL